MKLLSEVAATFEAFGHRQSRGILHLTRAPTRCIETVIFTGEKQASELQYHPPISGQN